MHNSWKNTTFGYPDVSNGGPCPDVDAYVPPSAVEARSEYKAPYDELLQYISLEMIAEHMPYVLNGEFVLD